MILGGKVGSRLNLTDSRLPFFPTYRNCFWSRRRSGESRISGFFLGGKELEVGSRSRELEEPESRSLKFGQPTPKPWFEL